MSCRSGVILAVLFFQALAFADSSKLSPQSSIPSIDLISQENDWLSWKKDRQKMLREKLFLALTDAFWNESRTHHRNIPQYVLQNKFRGFVRQQFDDLLDFIFSPIPERATDTPPLDFSFFLKSETTMSEIARQIAYLGRLQPGDHFVVSQKMTPREIRDLGAKTHATSRAGLDNQLKRLEGRIRMLENVPGGGDVLILELKTLQGATPIRKVFGTPAKAKLPTPQSKQFVFLGQDLETAEWAQISGEAEKLSLEDILKTFGFTSSSVRNFQFERNGILEKINDKASVIDCPTVYYLIANPTGQLIGVGMNLNESESDSPQDVEEPRYVAEGCLHHVHPFNSPWASDSDVSASLGTGFPMAITGENGIGLYYEPLFSRMKADPDQEAVLQRHAKNYVHAVDLLRGNRELQVWVQRAFLSHFFRIHEYRIPNRYLQSLVNPMKLSWRAVGQSN